METKTIDATDEINKLGGDLYTSYCAAVGGKAFNGDRLPDWQTFSNDPNKKVQADAWRRIGLDVLLLVEKEATKVKGEVIARLHDLIFG